MASLTVPGTPDSVTVTVFNGKTSSVAEYDGSTFSTIQGTTLNAVLASVDTHIAALETADSNIATSQIDDISSLTLNKFSSATDLDSLLDAVDSFANNLASTDSSHDASGYSFLATASATVGATLDDIDTKLAALGGGSVAISDGAFSQISGSTAQAAIASADGLIDTNITDISNNTSAITALQNADQTQTNTLVSGGGTINLDPATNKKFQYVAGSATLSSSYTIQTSGTPANGDEFWVFYNATMTLSGNSITIFGETLSAAEALSATILFITKYDGTAWRTIKFVDSDYLSANIQQNSSVVSKSTTYTANINEMVLCDASGGAFTVTLPTAASASGKEVTVKKTDASANAVTVDGNGSETIDGALTSALSSQWDSVVVVSNGSNWFIK